MGQPKVDYDCNGCVHEYERMSCGSCKHTFEAVEPSEFQESVRQFMGKNPCGYYSLYKDTWSWQEIVTHYACTVGDLRTSWNRALELAKQEAAGVRPGYTTNAHIVKNISKHDA